MRIAIILPWSFRFDRAKPRSIETVIRTINAHSRFRDQITVIADSGADDHGDMAVWTVDGSGGRWRRTRQVIDRLRADPPDLLELHQHIPTARRIADALDPVPAILYRHNPTRGKLGPLEGLRQSWIQKPFRARIFVSAFNADDHTRRFPHLAASTFAVPNPIDPEPWWHGSEDKEPVIAFTGGASPEKGLGELCAALTELLPRYPTWRAEILALRWHKHAAWSEHQVGPLAGLGDRVTIKRDQPIAAVQETLKRAAIAVVPSVYEEPFGLAAVEAHAAGAAVVSSGRGGLREASGDFAVYVDPITGPGLAQGIERLIRDPAGRTQLAAQGQDYVVRVHSPAVRADELDAIRLSAMEREPIRGPVGVLWPFGRSLPVRR